MTGRAKKVAISKAHGSPHLVELQGGPWHGWKITTRIPPGDTTLPIKVGAFRGMYRMSNRKLDEGKWEDV